MFGQYASDLACCDDVDAPGCVLHLGHAAGALPTRHCWLDSPALVAAASARFRRRGYDVVAMTAYSRRERWVAKYGAVAPLEQSDALQRALDDAGFSAVRCGADLGFVEWCPPPKRGGDKAPYRYTALRHATADDIKQCTTSGAKPDPIIEPSEMPESVRFRTDMPRHAVALNKFPYGQHRVAGLYHARRSGKCDLGTIDFYFGGSTLKMLSAQKIRKTNHYLAQRVPGTAIVMVQHATKYWQDYSKPGHQFERLLTGKPMDAVDDASRFEHVQILEVGRYRVLVAAEIDAVDGNGDPVEIKLKKTLGHTATFMQMISSGSLTLYRGKNEDGSLADLRQVPLSDMAREVAHSVDVAAWERHLLGNMDKLQEWSRQGHFADRKVFRVDFEAGAMKLRRARSEGSALLPPNSVLKNLLGL